MRSSALHTLAASDRANGVNGLAVEMGSQESLPPWESALTASETCDEISEALLDILERPRESTSARRVSRLDVYGVVWNHLIVGSHSSLFSILSGIPPRATIQGFPPVNYTASQLIAGN